MKNIFKNAKFRDEFVTRDGHIAVFYDFSPDKEMCRLLYEGEGLMMVYTNNGVFYQGNNDNYDIVSRYQNTIDEEKLDELADEAYDADLSISNTNWTDWDNAQDEIADAFVKGFKAGYHRAFNNTNVE